MDEPYHIYCMLGEGTFGAAFLLHFKDRFEVLKIPKGLYRSDVEEYLECLNQGLSERSKKFLDAKDKTVARENKRLIYNEKKLLRSIQGAYGVIKLLPKGSNHEIFMPYESHLRFLDFILERRALAFDLGGTSLLKYTKDCTTICKDITRTMMESQDKGLMLHSDIKPDNVLVIANLDSIEGRLIDYSCAATKEMISSKAKVRLANGHVYVPPELYFGKRASLRPNEKSDVYSIGLMLCRALSPDIEVYDQNCMILPGVFPYFQSLDCGKNIDTLLLNMVRATVSERYDMKTAYEHLIELEKYFQSRL